jgi:hypothetical protein
MRVKSLLFSVAAVLFTGTMFAQDVIIIPGGTENAGKLETIINGDVNGDGTRKNPNRIYKLEAGKTYIQQAGIVVDNPTGTLTIVGAEGGSKPVIIKVPLNDVAVTTNNINSNLTIKNVQWSETASDGSQTIMEQEWLITGDNRSIVIEDCLVEHGSQDTFKVPDGTPMDSIVFRNNYFRDFSSFNKSWWGGRVIYSKGALNKLIFENNTVSGGGIILLMENSMTDVVVINHNTFVNTFGYTVRAKFYREYYMTNNVFINGHMAGEDNNKWETQDPDKILMGITGVDTLSTDLLLPAMYGSKALPEISEYIYYAADNLIVSSTELDGYYNGDGGDFVGEGPSSKLDWFGVHAGAAHIVKGVPGVWMDTRTEKLVEDHSNIIDENNLVYTKTVADLSLKQNPLPQAAADLFIAWNKSEYQIEKENRPTDYSAYYFSDYDPTTFPGPGGEVLNGVGITKFSDLVENFEVDDAFVSKSDGLKIGAQYWGDEEFDSKASLEAVKSAYNRSSLGINENLIAEFELKSYPNPFTSTTTINFSLKSSSFVNITIIDISGRVISTVANETMSAGQHEVMFDAGHNVSGTYFYKLTTQKGSVTKKMILL